MLVSACPPSASPSGEAGGDTRLYKEVILIYPASSIQYLANCGINDRFQDNCKFGSGLSELWYSIIIFRYVVDYFIFKLCVEQFSGYAIIKIILSFDEHE
jgi:hypothetical protein